MFDWREYGLSVLARGRFAAKYSTFKIRYTALYYIASLFAAKSSRAIGSCHFTNMFTSSFASNVSLSETV